MTGFSSSLLKETLGRELNRLSPLQNRYDNENDSFFLRSIVVNFSKISCKPLILKFLKKAKPVSEF